ncbi:MAG TPA: phosphomannomutase/phosphoglucomutase [Propionicimonas sp.]|jgi:phosphomannomutase|nr:phosphomannomutase/phosphoglucomutase [Propionicimonas sp.]
MISQGVFKANDLRGLVSGEAPEWDVDGARAVGAAFAAAFGLAGGEFVLGRDTRLAGRELSLAFAEGAMRLGAGVVDIGLASTDQLWYASGVTGFAGVQFTASHNPAGYNGIKFCLPHAAPITPELMAAIRELTWADLPDAARPGVLRETDLLPGYAAHLRSLVPLDGVRRLRVVVDAGNGMAGHTTPAVLGDLVDVVGLYLDLDGRFPNHPPNPLDPANLVDARRAVLEHHADLGLVFDGDADRCFIIDERGEVVDPAVVISLIARSELGREPGAAIVVNTITSTAVAEEVAAAGGRLVVGKVGHTYLKALMAEHDAIFGGEHSAHYYFRDFWGADTGMLAALHVISLVGRGDATMSELAAGVPSRAASGELNSTVADPAAVMDAVAAAFAGEGEAGWEDGLLVRGPDWWLSVRASNTEPLLRLNVEAGDPDTMTRLRDRALAIIRP